LPTASLVFCRLAQGFFAGGEYTAATAYIVEQGSSRHRALRASFSPAAAYAGTAIAVGIFTLVSAVIGAESMASWGWRLMFGLGVPLGFWVSGSAPRSMNRRSFWPSKKNAVVSVRKHHRSRPWSAASGAACCSSSASS